MEKAKGNHSTISPNNAWQLTDNKRTDSVESLDRLRSEGTRHVTEILNKVGLHGIGDEVFTREAIQS